MRIYLIHGFLENSTMWDFTENLPLEFVRLTLPGHGKDVSNIAPNTMEEVAQFVLQQIDVSQPYAIIGHSMGGYLIATLLRLGARPDKIGLFHSKLNPDNDAKKNQRQRAIELVGENKNLYVRTMISNLFPEPFKIKKYHVIDTLVKDAFNIRVETIQHCQQAMINRKGFIEGIHQLNIPIHFFAGTEDLSVPLCDIQEEHATIKNSTLTIQDGIGHMGQWECPEIAAHWIESHF